MQMNRNWQDSFDRLEQSRREEQRMREAEEREMRLSEAAYARASLDAASAEMPNRAETTGFMLADAIPDLAEVLATAKPPAKSPAAKSPDTKADPRKRAAPRRKARVAKPRTAKLRTAKPRTAKSKAAKPGTARAKVAKPRAAALELIEPPTTQLFASLSRSQPVSAATPPAMAARAQSPAEPLLITPLPRSASLARYSKPGLFGLIGSWLRLASRRPKLPEKLGKPARQSGQPRDDLAALREENKQLRRELEALLALREAERAETPPWATTPMATPAGDAPARPRRRGRVRAQG